MTPAPTPPTGRQSPPPVPAASHALHHRAVLAAWIALASLALLPPLSATAAAQPAGNDAFAQAPLTVLLVRHAEKAKAGRRAGDDPGLTRAGRARARELARMLADAGVVSASGVDAVYVSPYRRTRETGAPLAEQLSLRLREYDPAAPAALVTRLRREHAAGATVLVVGHSNTLGPLVEALGGRADVPPIDDDEYDNLFVVTLAGNTVSTLRLHYGRR